MTIFPAGFAKIPEWNLSRRILCTALDLALGLNVLPPPPPLPPTGPTICLRYRSTQLFLQEVNLVGLLS